MPSWAFHRKWAKKLGIPEDITQEINKVIDLGMSYIYREFQRVGIIRKGQEHDLKKIFENRAIRESVFREIELKCGNNEKLKKIYFESMALHYFLDKIRDYTRDFFFNKALHGELYLEKYSLDENLFRNQLLADVYYRFKDFIEKNQWLMEIGSDSLRKVLLNLPEIIKDFILSREINLQRIIESAIREREIYEEEKKTTENLLEVAKSIIQEARAYMRIGEIDFNDLSYENIHKIKMILGQIANRHSSRIPMDLANRAKQLLTLIKMERIIRKYKKD